MNVTGFLKQTYIDFPNKIASAVFVGDCNYACPSCHAKPLLTAKRIEENEIFAYLDRAKGFIDGVVICGGEPTTQKDLPEFARKIKEMGLAVKLDTNGSNPEMLRQLKEDKNIDYLAMDVKGPWDLYPMLVGKSEKENVERSMRIAMDFPEYEFRTTIVPVYKNGKAEWLSQEDMNRMKKWILDTTGKTHRHYLQKFVARHEDEMMSSMLAKENLPKDMWETPTVILHSLQSGFLLRE
ncbi:MAG: anaerobic ribonucleoside-triphosphate reductase activating protein [archaeon]